MRKNNFSLIFGGILLLLILVVICFPQIFTDKSPYNMERLRCSTVDGKLAMDLAPHPPSSDFFLGSDDYGRDIYSRIIYGTRLTILMGVLIALGRFLIALPIALSGGFGNQSSKSLIKQFNTIFSAIPAILVSIIILSLDFFAGLSKTGSIISFVLILSLVSWAALGDVMLERIESINKQSFIVGETAIGKKRIKIATENVIPHLAPELIILFFMEIARALSMIMQLGIFSIFIGNLKIILSTDGGGLVFANVSFEPEWASMLGSSRNMLSAAPWALLYPALAFFISVLAFNMFGEGLRNIMQKKDSRVIPTIRKFVSFDIIKMLKSLSRNTKIKILVVISLMISILATQYFYNLAHYRFEIEETIDIPYEQVIIGTDSSVDTAQLITEQMKELSLEPLRDNSYIIDYEISKACINIEQSFQINSYQTTLSPTVNQDYAFVKTGNFDYTAFIYDATQEDMYSMKDYDKFNDKFVLLDKSYYNDSSINYFISEINKNSTAKGILLATGSNDSINNFILNESDDIFVLLVSQELSKEIKNNISESITISASIKSLDTTGKNIIGIFRGSGLLNDEAVIIGMRYNYVDKDGAEIVQFNLELMRRLCLLYENKRSIIFMFVDGTLGENQNGIYPISENFPYPSSEIKVYIDLTTLNQVEFDQVRFSSAQAPFTRQYAWSIAHQLEGLFAKRNMDVDKLVTAYAGGEYIFTEDAPQNTLFWTRGFATIVIGTGTEGKKHDIYDIGSLILEVINKNNY